MSDNETSKWISQRMERIAVLESRVVELEAENNRLRHPNWETYKAITKQWLSHYPADIFDGSSGDPGPLFVVAIRTALEALEGGQ